MDPTAHSCRVLRRNNNVSLTPFHMGDHKTAAQAFVQQALKRQKNSNHRVVSDRYAAVHAGVGQ